jgi:hypothetical protein
MVLFRRSIIMYVPSKVLTARIWRIHQFTDVVRLEKRPGYMHWFLLFWCCWAEALAIAYSWYRWLWWWSVHGVQLRVNTISCLQYLLRNSRGPWARGSETRQCYVTRIFLRRINTFAMSPSLSPCHGCIVLVLRPPVFYISQREPINKLPFTTGSSFQHQCITL